MKNYDAMKNYIVRGADDAPGSPYLSMRRREDGQYELDARLPTKAAALLGQACAVIEEAVEWRRRAAEAGAGKSGDEATEAARRLEAEARALMVRVFEAAFDGDLPRIIRSHDADEDPGAPLSTGRER